MKPKTILWAIIAVLVAVIAATTLFKPAGGGIENVDAAGVQAAMQQPGVQIIDVRSQGEYQMGHLAGAINVPVEQVATAAASWDKSATYIVYCASGDRSSTAVQTMQSMGFTSIKHFSAGLIAWNGQLEKGSSSSTTKVETNGKPVMIEFFTDS